MPPPSQAIWVRYAGITTASRPTPAGHCPNPNPACSSGPARPAASTTSVHHRASSSTQTSGRIPDHRRSDSSVVVPPEPASHPQPARCRVRCPGSDRGGQAMAGSVEQAGGQLASVAEQQSSLAAAVRCEQAVREIDSLLKDARQLTVKRKFGDNEDGQAAAERFAQAGHNYIK